MITYDRGIRTLLHSTLRRFCGPVGGARRRAGIDATLHAHDATALACLGASCRRRNPAPAQRKRRLACVAGIAIVLAAMIAPSRPAQAQDGAAASAFIYLPAIVTGRAWFTEDELEAAQAANGDDPETAAMHTNCRLDPSSQPPALIRYLSCNQYYVDGQATEEAGTPLWFYWKNYYDPAVSAALISSATGSDAQADGAFCYIDADGDEVCG